MLSNSNIKLIDLGFATTIEPHRKSQVYCGTPNYMSPEMVSKVLIKIQQLKRFPTSLNTPTYGLVALCCTYYFAVNCPSEAATLVI